MRKSKCILFHKITGKKGLMQIGSKAILALAIMGLSVMFLFNSQVVKAQGESLEKQYLWTDRIISENVQETCWKHENGRECSAIIYSAPKWIYEEGKYQNFSDVVSMSFSNGVIRMAYSDKYWVDLMPFFVINVTQAGCDNLEGSWIENRCVLGVQAARSYMQANGIGFNTLINKLPDRYKYGLNFTSLPPEAQNRLLFVGLKLENASGLSWDDVRIEGNSLIIKERVKLGFQDLIDSNFTLQMYDKRTLLIGNVSGKSELWLDPTVGYLLVSGDDDAHEQGDGTFDRTGVIATVKPNSNSGSSSYYCAGVRFSGVTIPQGSNIISAKFTTYTYLGSVDDPHLTVYAHDTDNSSDFNTNAHIISTEDRPRTTASTAWNQDNVGVGWQPTPDISNVVEEVTNRSGWASGNAITFLMIANVNSDPDYVFYTIEKNSGEYTPYMNVTYTVNSAPNAPSYAEWNETTVLQNEPATLNVTANDPDDNEDSVWATIDYPDENTTVYNTILTLPNVTVYINNSASALGFESGIEATSEQYASLEKPHDNLNISTDKVSGTYAFHSFIFDMGDLDVSSVNRLKITWIGTSSGEFRYYNWTAGASKELYDVQSTGNVYSAIITGDISALINSTTKQMQLLVWNTATVVTDYVEVAINTTTTNITLSRDGSTDYWNTSSVNTSNVGTYSVDVIWINDTSSELNYTDYSIPFCLLGGSCEAPNNVSFVVTAAPPSAYLYINSTSFLPSSPVTPIENSNVSMNITINVTNSTTLDSCLVRIFNSTDSYASPTKGPLSGTLQLEGSQWQCYQTWNMEYWRNDGTWNISVYINLTDSTENSTNTSFTYNTLTAINLTDNTWDGETLTPGVGYTLADPITFKNTGNQIYSVNMTGHKLVGQTDPLYNISESSLKVDSDSDASDGITVSTSSTEILASLGIDTSQNIYLYINTPNIKAQTYTAEDTFLVETA